jgi:hypothetical protein
MDALSLVALGLGAAWASGINLYAAVLLLGGLHAVGLIPLPPDLEVLSDPVVLVVAGFLYVIEFIADKVPGVDSVWDAFHSFIRIPAGALLAAGAIGSYGDGYEVAAALLAGGALAATSHAAKAGGRVVVNTSPEPFSNWAVSFVEDLLVLGGLFLALFKPALFLTLLGAFVLMAIWFLPKLWRGLRRLFGGRKRAAEAEPSPLPLDFGALRDEERPPPRNN